MKIAIIGYSGSGKSTLAQELGAKSEIPVLHLDRLHWLPGWHERDRDDELNKLGEFLDENESWIIDGNYRSLHFGRRMEEADCIIFMDFNRFACLARAYKRYRAYKGKARNSITEGCDEKIDLEFFLWLIWHGRTKKRRRLFTDTVKNHSQKVVVIKNQKQLDAYRTKQGLS